VTGDSYKQWASSLIHIQLDLKVNQRICRIDPILTKDLDGGIQRWRRPTPATQAASKPGSRYLSDVLD
jgi:hypothetical protein